MEELINLSRSISTLRERLNQLAEDRRNANDDLRFSIDQQIAEQRAEIMRLEQQYYTTIDSRGYDSVLAEYKAALADSNREMPELEEMYRITMDARERALNDTRIVEEEREVEVLEPVGSVIEEANASITQMYIQREIERIAAERGRSPEDYTTGPITEGDDTEREGLGEDNPLNRIGIFEKNKKTEVIKKRVRDVQKVVEEEQEVEVLEPVGKVIEEANASITQMYIQREIERLAAEKGKSPEDFTTGPITEGDDTERDGYGDDNPLNYIGIFEKVKKVEKVQKTITETIEVPDETEMPEKPTDRRKKKPEPEKPDSENPEPPVPPVPPEPPVKDGDTTPEKPDEDVTRGGTVPEDAKKGLSIVYEAKSGKYIVTRQDGTTEEHIAKAINKKKQGKLEYIESQIPKEFLDIILTMPIPNMPSKTLKKLDPDLIVILYKEFGGGREGAYAARDYVLSLAGKTRGYDRDSLKYTMTYDLSKLGEAKYSNGEPITAIDRARIINLADANKNVAEVKISEKTKVPLWTRIALGIKNAVSRIGKGEKKALPAAEEPKEKPVEEAESVKYGAELDATAPKLDLTRTVEYLQKCKADGKNVYIDFNGRRLYSQDVTLESAYIDVVGTPKDVHEAFSKKLKEAEAVSKAEAEKVRAEWNKARADYRAKKKEEENAKGFAERIHVGPDSYVQPLELSGDALVSETPKKAPERDDK